MERPLSHSRRVDPHPKSSYLTLARESEKRKEAVDTQSTQKSSFIVEKEGYWKVTQTGFEAVSLLLPNLQFKISKEDFNSVQSVEKVVRRRNYLSIWFNIGKLLKY